MTTVLIMMSCDQWQVLVGQSSREDVRGGMPHVIHISSLSLSRLIIVVIEEDLWGGDPPSIMMLSAFHR